MWTEFCSDVGCWAAVRPPVCLSVVLKRLLKSIEYLRYFMFSHFKWHVSTCSVYIAYIFSVLVFLLSRPSLGMLNLVIFHVPHLGLLFQCGLVNYFVKWRSLVFSMYFNCPHLKLVIASFSCKWA